MNNCSRHVKLQAHAGHQRSYMNNSASAMLSKAAFYVLKSKKKSLIVCFKQIEAKREKILLQIHNGVQTCLTLLPPESIPLFILWCDIVS